MLSHSEVSSLNEGLIAVDIGTTNIEVMLCDTGRSVIECRAERNEQRRFGADVAARICAATDGHGDDMRVSVLSQICGLVTGLVTAHPDTDVTHIVMAGNTTMLHLLMGYDCSGLGVYPFTPVSLAEIKTTSHELISDYLTDVDPAFPDIPVTVLPGISAYLGADIYAGAIACGFSRNENVCMLIDLGTNAEIVVGNKDRILTASAAAGPAFESGRIFKGTEGIEMLHRLLSLGVIDRTGLMAEEYFEQPAQKNIRKLQLAKAAIHAAIGILLRKYGIDGTGLDKVYISGNFGNNVNEEACIAVGMLPESFKGRLKSAGNTVLDGCISYILDESSRLPMSCFEEVILANEPDFNEILMNSIDL